MKKVLAILMLCIVPSIILAECNLRARTVYQTYQPTYYAPAYVAPTYVAPTYHQEYEKIVLVPKAIKVEVQRNHYYSLDTYAQQNLLADAIVGRLLRVQSEQGGGGGYAAPPAIKPNNFAPAGPPKMPAAEDEGPPVAGAHQDPNLLKVLNESCAKCHGANSKYTKLVTADGKIADVRAGKVWESFARVNSGNMPKGGKSLEDASVKLFYAWGEVARK